MTKTRRPDCQMRFPLGWARKKQRQGSPRSSRPLARVGVDHISAYGLWPGLASIIFLHTAFGQDWRRSSSCIRPLARIGGNILKLIKHMM